MSRTVYNIPRILSIINVNNKNKGGATPPTTSHHMLWTEHSRKKYGFINIIESFNLWCSRLDFTVHHGITLFLQSILQESNKYGIQSKQYQYNSNIHRNNHNHIIGLFRLHSRPSTINHRVNGSCHINYCSMVQ